MKFANKVALITGGASGLGLATAKELLAGGATVMIADYSPKGQEVADEIGASFVRVDVTQPAQIKAMVDKTVEEFGQINIVVASAGIGGDLTGIAECTKENWDKVNAVDYSGVMYTDKYAIEQMRKQGTGGAIVNLASMYGLVAVPNNVSYSASKGGVVNLTKAAGTTFAHEGIRVNAVCPGVIDTPLIPEETKIVYQQIHPMNRLGQDWEVAKLIAFLASDDALFISGACIPIDGGYTAV